MICPLLLFAANALRAVLIDLQISKETDSSPLKLQSFVLEIDPARTGFGERGNRRQSDMF